MRKLFAVAALGLALTGFAIAPAAAQATARDAVLAACGGSGANDADCAVAMAAFVASVQGLTPRQKDAALADVVVALANTAGPAAQAVAAAAIRSVSTEFSEPARAQAAIEVAAAVETGTAADDASVQALSASSN